MNTIKIEQGQLLKAAVGLTKALGKVADENLPEKLAGIVKLHAGVAVGSATSSGKRNPLTLNLPS